MEKQPRDRQAEPDDESEQTQHVNQRQAPDPFLPKLPEVRNYADGEEGHHEKDTAEDVATESSTPAFLRYCIASR